MVLRPQGDERHHRPFDLSPSPARILGTLGGIGRFPVAPGTVASAAALAVAAAVPARAYGPTMLALIAAALAVAPWAARRMAEQTGDEDPRAFVLDEAIGVWLAVLRPARPALLTFALAFVLFRTFDIWKPGPIRRLERIGRGWGVVLDDVAAGVLAGAVMLAMAAVGGWLRG